MTDVSGTTRVFRLHDEFELLGESELGEPVFATPAIVGDRIYIRGSSQLFCIREAGGDPAAKPREVREGR